MILPSANLVTLVMIGEDQVRLYPGNPLFGEYEQFRNSLGRQLARLIQFVAARLGDGFNPAFHGDAMGRP